MVLDWVSWKCCQALCCCEHGLLGPVTIYVHCHVPGHRPGPLLSLFGKQRCLGFTVSFFVPFIFQLMLGFCGTDIVERPEAAPEEPPSHLLFLGALCICCLDLPPIGML